MIQMLVGELQRKIAVALEANNVSEANAASVAKALACAQWDGQLGHGVSRVASYCAQARSGKVDGHAVPQVQIQGAVARINACNGFAYPALDIAIDTLAELSDKHGVSVGGIYNSHHCGVAGHSVERLAEKGLAALMMANAPAAMVPKGGRTPVFGTNPVAFACPRGEGKAPVVVDLSLSEAARGKVMLAAKEGRTIPIGWGVDSQGQPTTDPHQVLNGGSMVPMGDAKGSALALMVELLAAALVGANPSFEASSFFDAQGPAPGVGQWMLVLNPDFFSGDEFLARVESILSAIEVQARLPGQRRLTARQDRQVTISDTLMEELEAATLAG